MSEININVRGELVSLKDIRNELEGENSTFIDYMESFFQHIEHQHEQIEKLQSQNKTQMESINGLLKKVKELEEVLKKIVEETNCDDTWDFVNRILYGKEMTNLPYRINNN